MIYFEKKKCIKETKKCFVELFATILYFNIFNLAFQLPRIHEFVDSNFF